MDDVKRVGLGILKRMNKTGETMAADSQLAKPVGK